MAFPIENPGQRNVAEVNWARPTKQDKINVTKGLTDFALTRTQEAVAPRIGQAVANKYPQVPRIAIQEAVSSSATQVKNKTQEVANKVIESDYCYGNEDSCISRWTNLRLK